MTAGRDYPHIIPAKDLSSSRLIDTGVYFYNASLQGEAERYRRGTTTHTIHVWWARRPHRAMLPLVYASLITGDHSPATIDTMALLSIQSDPDTLKIAAEHITQQYKQQPRVLDVFGGGGTIPQSAASLGVDSYAIDINPLSVFIQKCYLEYYPQLGITADQMASAVNTYGSQLLDDLESRTASCYPSRNKHDETVVAYLWSYRYSCQSCGYSMYLSRRPWISKKPTNKQTRDEYIALALENLDQGQVVSLNKIDKSDTKSYQKKYESKSVVDTKTCIRCRQDINLDITEVEDSMLVKVLNHGYGEGKSFLLADRTDIDLQYLETREQQLLEKLSINLSTDFPDIPRWSGITNPTLYGITNYYHIFNTRQRVIMLELVVLLRAYYEKITEQESELMARCITGILSSFVDQLVDWNCRITMWISQNLQPGRAFSGPGVPMYWDYCEIDPLQDGPANLRSKLRRIERGVESLPDLTQSSTIRVGKAQSLSFPDQFFDAVVTDPPYYDNIFYSILADFIYCWKYQIFHDRLDKVFVTPTSHNDDELVASSNRNEGDSLQAHRFYTNQMTKALYEVYRVLKKDGVLSFVYSHASLRGWMAIVEAFQQTCLIISSIQPLTIERKARPRAMNAVSIDSCLVFVAHKINQKELPQHLTSFEKIRQNFPFFAQKIDRSLSYLGFEDRDRGLAVFANGAAMIANLEADHSNQIRDQLLQLEEVTQQIVPDFRLTDRSSL